MDIQPYLKLMVEKKASDLFFTVGTPVKIKIEGKAAPVGKTVLTSDLCKAAAYSIMNEPKEERMDNMVPRGVLSALRLISWLLVMRAPRAVEPGESANRFYAELVYISFEPVSTGKHP